MKTINLILTLFAVSLGILGFVILNGYEARILKIISLVFVLFRVFSFIIYEFNEPNKVYNTNLTKSKKLTKV